MSLGCGQFDYVYEQCLNTCCVSQLGLKLHHTHTIHAACVCDEKFMI